MKKAVAIRHVAFEDLGLLQKVLQEHSYDIVYLEAGVDSLSESDALDADLLVVLGGPISAYEEKEYPFLRDEISLLERRLREDRPTLGICLGAQLMARALGAKVYPGSGKEIGWGSLTLSEAGLHSPLASLAGEGVRVLHWHGDTFDLPSEAVHLASTPRYQNQAFSCGKNGLALQFHIEVNPRAFERWLIGHAGEISATPGISVAGLRQETAIDGPRLEERAMGVLSEWVEKMI